MRNHKKYFFIALFLAIGLRLILLHWSITYPLDINGDQTRYEDWAQIAHIYGPAKTYEPSYVKTIPTRLPPGSTYLVSGTYEVYIVIGKIINKITHTQPGSIHWVNNDLLHKIMRVPGILADILMGIVLYLIVKEKGGGKAGILAASLIWFNPVTLYNSSIWGQTDSVTSLFMLFSLYLAFRKNYLLSILSFVISLYIKMTMLPLFPFFLVFLYFYSKRQWKKILLGIFLSILVIIAATYPISPTPLNWLFSKWPVFLSGEMADISAAAFNFWWAVTCIPNFCREHLSSYTLFWGIPLSFWAFSLFALLIIPVFYFQIKRAKLFIKKEYLFLCLSLVTLISFLFLPRMHDRYLYPFFILFAPVVALSKNRVRLLIIFIFLSLLHFINLLSSWYPTRYPSLYYSDIMYGHPLRFMISVLTLAVSVYLYLFCLKWFSKKDGVN